MQRSRWAWARLSADTLFVVLFSVFTGLFDIYDPARDAVTSAILASGDSAQPLHFLRCLAYVFSGLLLLLALLRNSVKLEVIARCCLCSAVALNVYRHIYWLEPGSSHTWSEAGILAALLAVTYLRLSFLLGGRGVVVSHEPSKGDR